MNTKTFYGTGVAMVTPFRNQDTIDFNQLENLIEFNISSGVNYIVALGTTSEAATMTAKEKAAVLDFILETTNGRVPVMLGMGGNCTQQVCDSIAQTTFDGVTAILSVCPYYNKPNQSGIYAHFKQIADISPVPVVLYNVPGRTGVNMQAETTLRLAEHPNIIGVKEASGNVEQAMNIIRNKPKDFLVISGDDALTLPLISCGAAGVISVAANAFPKEMSDMVQHALKGNLKKAQDIHYRLLPMMKAMFAEGNPTGIKAFLNVEGRISNNLRMPLVPASDELFATISRLYNEFLQQ